MEECTLKCCIVTMVTSAIGMGSSIYGYPLPEVLYQTSMLVYSDVQYGWVINGCRTNLFYSNWISDIDGSLQQILLRKV